MKVAIVVLVFMLAGCGSLIDAWTDNVPADKAALHAQINQQEKILFDELEARVLDVNLIQGGEFVYYFDQIQAVKIRLNEFALWLRKSKIDDRIYDVVIIRLRVWEDMQAFFCTQEDAYFKDKLPLDEGTKAEVLKYLDFLVEASDSTEEWIVEKGVIEND